MIIFLKKILKKIIIGQQSLIIRDSDLEYLLWICNLYLRIKSVPGHIAEIGVADGRNSVLFGRLIKIHNDHSVRQYVGFDTFDGYTKDDLDRDIHLNKNNWKNNSKKKVLIRCEENDIADLVEIFEGDVAISVPKILKEHKGKKFHRGKSKFALLYIDCNAFNPAIKSMEYFLPHMSPGGLIVIDEKLQGSETEAILNFGRKHGLIPQRLGTYEVPMALKVEV